MADTSEFSILPYLASTGSLFVGWLVSYLTTIHNERRTTLKNLQSAIEQVRIDLLLNIPQADIIHKNSIEILKPFVFPAIINIKKEESRDICREAWARYIKIDLRAIQEIEHSKYWYASREHYEANFKGVIQPAIEALNTLEESFEYTWFPD